MDSGTGEEETWAIEVEAVVWAWLEAEEEEEVAGCSII